jgi:hypothetical protein
VISDLVVFSGSLSGVITSGRVRKKERWGKELGGWKERQRDRERERERDYEALPSFVSSLLS